MRIWKWQIDLTDYPITLEMPADAQILDVQMQNGKCCMWALCDHRRETQSRALAIYGTGAPIPDKPGKYVATFQMNDGEFVFHVFEVKP